MHGEEQGWEAAEISPDVGCSCFTPVLENWSGRLQCQSLSGCFGLCPLRIALTCFTPITGVLKSCVGRRAREGKEEEEEEIAHVLGCSPLWVPGAPRWSHGGASPHPPCPCPPLSLPLATSWKSTVLAHGRWQNLLRLGVLIELALYSRVLEPGQTRQGVVFAGKHRARQLVCPCEQQHRAPLGRTC